VGNKHALTLLSPHDGRVLFVLPGEAHAIIGTTDTYSPSTPDDVRATNDDVLYLLDSANAFFPRAQLTQADVVASWAGIRPLIPTAGATPGAASREHLVTTSPNGLVSITGGKLTTYRVMAADAVRVVLERLHRQAGVDQTKSLPLPGGDFTSLDAVVAAAAHTTGDTALAAHLSTTYGTRWPLVWAEIDTADGRPVLDDALPYRMGELSYAVRNEMALTLGDLLIRRTHVAFETRDHGVGIAARVVDAVAPILGWDQEARRRALDDYVQEVARIFSLD
jgi:glycerol-3-phosphate dehydrogenase